MHIQNGQTGPKTVKGKKISSLNALKSGIYARTLVLPFEDERAYKRHLKSILESLDPQNALEKNLAEEIANSIWRGTRMQLNESVQHDEIFMQLTPKMMAGMLCDDQEKIDQAPNYLLDLKHTFSKKVRAQYSAAYKQYLHLMQNSRGIQNYQMVWLNYQNFFLLLGEWMKGQYEPTLFMATGKGLDIAWQNSPQLLEAAIKKYAIDLWWAIHFDDLKPQIRNWMSSWYFLSAINKHKVTSVQDQIVKERRFCQGLMDSFMKLKKSRLEQFLFESKYPIHLYPTSNTKVPVNDPCVQDLERVDSVAIAQTEPNPSGENEIPEKPIDSTT